MSASNNDSDEKRRSDMRSEVMIGELPNDFLRLDSATNTTVQQYQPTFFQQQNVGILTITIVEARLVKNYGVLSRMDPYCRVRVGAQVFETGTAYNGAKTPRWNKIIQCQIQDGVKEIYLEMFDECTFTVDERIAWVVIPIPESVFKGETLNDYFSLSGKKGDDKEGMIEIMLQYRKGIAPPMMMPMVQPSPVMLPNMIYLPQQQYQIQQQQLQQQQHMLQQQQLQQQQQQVIQLQQQHKEKEVKNIKTLKEMCPELDEEIIQSVLRQSKGNMEQAASQLLEMTAT